MNRDTLMDCDKEDAGEVTAEQPERIVKTKKHKRKKIRRLADTEKSETLKITRRFKCKRKIIITALIILAIGLFTGHYFTQNFNKNRIIKEFLRNYRNQYIEIVHGKSNYCDQEQHLNTSSLFASIRKAKILHQEQSMYEIELALQNESDLNAIALVGAVGVGKTMFVRALQENFPWQENVHIYSWNVYVDDEANKFHLIRMLIENLSECGQNLLVIENLQVCDHGAVNVINNMLIEANKMQHKRVVLFYIFSLNTMLTSEAYALQHETLQSLPNCSVIYFKSFSELELKDCIKREAEMENVALTENGYDEIVETINPSISGCKNVNAKVLMYGKNKT